MYVAGLLSFFSPCLVPLLPSYFSMITGFTFKDLYGLNDKDVKMRMFVSSVLFVVGFTIVYAILGATGTFIGKFIQKNINLLIQVSGLFLIVLGLIQLGVIHFKNLQYDFAWNVQKRLAHLGYASALITGIACALIWIPCVGQILTAVLIVASKETTALKGLVMLVVFSLGLGTPFLVLGLFFPSIYPLIQKYRKGFYIANKGTGVLMVLFGILLLINQYQIFIDLMKEATEFILNLF